MIKKLLACISLATAVAFPVSVNAAGIEEGQLTIWLMGGKSFSGFSILGQKFEKNTGVHVSVAQPEQAEIKFQQTAASGNGPDIFLWAHDRLGEWVQQGVVASLNIDSKFYKKIPSFAWDAVTIDGNIYGYPLSVEAVGLLCNKDIVKKIPTSIEEFVKLDAQLQPKGIKAIMWDYGSPYYTYPFISSQGGYAFRLKPNNTYDVENTGINNEGSQYTLNYIKNMIKNGVLVKGVDFGVMQSSFINGKVACIIDGPWSWDNYSTANIDFSVTQLPTLNGKPLKAFVGVYNIMINNSSPNKDLAKEFIENYVLTDEGMSIIDSDNPVGVAALSSYEKIQESKKNIGERIKATKDNAAHGELMPNIPEMNRFWSAFSIAITNATTGRQTVEDALRTAETRILPNTKANQ